MLLPGVDDSCSDVQQKERDLESPCRIRREAKGRGDKRWWSTTSWWCQKEWREWKEEVEDESRASVKFSCAADSM